MSVSSLATAARSAPLTTDAGAGIRSSAIQGAAATEAAPAEDGFASMLDQLGQASPAASPPSPLANPTGSALAVPPDVPPDAPIDPKLLALTETVASQPPAARPKTISADENHSDTESEAADPDQRPVDPSVSTVLAIVLPPPPPPPVVTPAHGGGLPFITSPATSDGTPSLPSPDNESLTDRSATGPRQAVDTSSIADRATSPAHTVRPEHTKDQATAEAPPAMPFSLADTTGASPAIAAPTLPASMPLPPAGTSLSAPAGPSPPVTTRQAASVSNDAPSPRTPESLKLVSEAAQPTAPSLLEAATPPLPPTTGLPTPLAQADHLPEQPTSSPVPAAQVARAIVEPVKIVLNRPTQANAAEPHVTTIQITPLELGRVDVRIERIADGTARIELVAERPETLSRLIHDQSHLHRALDQAGLAATGRTIEFALAPPAAPSASPSLAGNDTFGQSTSGQDGNGNGSHRNPSRYPGHHSASVDDSEGSIATIRRMVRSNIDITA